jgi:hypothetical protein
METATSIAAATKKAHDPEPAIPSPERSQLPGDDEQSAPSVRLHHVHFVSVTRNGGDNHTGAIKRDHELVSSRAVAWLATQGPLVNHGDGHTDAQVVIPALIVPKHESNATAKVEIGVAFV